MADYAATITLDVASAKKITTAPAMGMITGNVNVTNYHSTGIEITDLTRYFVDSRIFAVLACGVTDAGYLLSWNSTDQCFDAWATAATTSVATAQAALAEATDDVDVGAVDFIAFGLVR
jgi:hypothetical protein